MSTETCALPVSPAPGSREDDELACRWLRDVANGDRTSFRKLHDRFDGLLFSTIHKVLNDREDSEDVTQEVFARIWTKAGLYSRDKGRPATWLASMARNAAIDRLRLKQRRARLLGGFESEVKVRESVAGGSGPGTGADLALRRERCGEVRRAVMKLSADQQEVIRLAYFEGKTQRAIAREVGKPLGTVKARVRRAMASLRQKL